MHTHIALLRGINVGGHNRLPMAELTAILEALGASGVRTYIQSGNAVFTSACADRAELAAALAGEIRRRHGFDCQAMVLAPAELAVALAGNPFPEAEATPEKLHLGFLAAASQADLAPLRALGQDGERCHLTGQVFYLHTPQGIGRSRLAAGAERRLGVPMTLRNWRTVSRLRDLAFP